MAKPKGKPRAYSHYLGQEISCRFVFPVFDQIKQKGIPPDSLLQGIPYDLAHIYDKNRWVSWENYTRILANARPYLTEQDLVEIGYRIVFSPVSQAFLLLVRHTTNPQTIFELGTVQDDKIQGSWLKERMLFSCLSATVKPIASHQLEYEIFMHEGYDICETHFHIARGGLLAISTIHGQKEAKVSMEIKEDRAVYQIVLPPKPSLFSRIKAQIYSLLPQGQSISELKLTLEELQEQNEKLRQEMRRREIAESQLQKSQTFSHHLTETMQDGFIVFKPDKSIVSINPAYCKMVGYEAEELLQQNLPLKHWPDDMRNLLGDYLERSLKEGEKPLEAEFVHKNGERFPVSIVPNLVRNKQGKIEFLLVLVRNISDVKRAQAILRENNQILEHKVIERTIELRQANAALEKFVLFASHDLREPVRMINTYLQLLEKKIKHRLENFEEEYLDFAIDGAKRLHTLLVDLLDYSRLQKDDFPRQNVDLNLIVAEVLVNLDEAIQESKVKLQIRNLPTIRGNPIQMTRVFQNLIHNAIKFRNLDEEPHIWITAKEKPDTWEIQVKDNGIGIPEEFRDQIFEIFRRLHSRSHYKGSGLGLAICKDIIAQHGGKIWIESHQEGASVPRGTSFVFTLQKELQTQESNVIRTELKS
jgi:PAS domain S-box-containing protein